ncbi:MAG TPA: universal stress protein [Methylomirabilota bacterium]|jgi:nucleotide-binding universal stress UspA family protein|nr:universal stress protein [Methylomirabilota bacterium]
MARRILHPSDFSSASRAAFRKAIDMAKASRAELLLLHVVSPVVPVPGDGYVSPEMYDQLSASSRAWAQKRLDSLVAQAKKSRARVKGFILEGAASDEIVRFARARRVELIVMGTHGRKGIAKLFVGSVADRVVAAATCPVLTVRGK